MKIAVVVLRNQDFFVGGCDSPKDREGAKADAPLLGGVASVGLAGRRRPILQLNQPIHCLENLREI